VTEHSITINGKKYRFELHSYPTGDLMQVSAPGVVAFDVRSLGEARDALRSVYAQQDYEVKHGI
jgi:hypothetical protein